MPLVPAFRRPGRLGTLTIALLAALSLLPGCHQNADVDSLALPIPRLHDDALPANLPPAAPLFTAALPKTDPVALVTNAPLPPPPPDAGQVAQQASAPDPAPAPPKTAPSAGGPRDYGLVVCDPVPATPALMDFGVGCGHWLHLMAAGQVALSRTPLWDDRKRMEQELGRDDLRLAPAQAAALAGMTGATHAACGRLEGGPTHGTLTYQMYTLPDLRPVGAPVSVSGAQAQIVAALPSMARALDARLGVAAHVPTSVGLSADDLSRLGGTTHAAALSDSDLLAISRMADRSPLAGVMLMETRATEDQIVLNRTVKSLMAQQPENTLVLAHIGYRKTEALRPYAAPTEAFIRRQPQNYLLAHTEVWEQRVWGTRAGEWKAAQRAVRDAPRNPDAWLSRAWTAAQIAGDLRQGRFAQDITPREGGYLHRFYAQQEDDALQATRLDPKYGHAWEVLAEAATFASDSETAPSAFWQALKLDPDKAEVYYWGLEMFQPKWGGDPATLDRVAQMAATEPYTACNEAIEIAASVRGLQWATKDAKYTALGDGVLARYITRARETVREQPGSAQAHWDLAGALSKQKDPVSLREATVEYRIASHLLPNSAQLHYWLANILDQRQRGREAIAELRQAVALDPFYAKAHFDLGYDLKHQRQFPEALSELRLAMRLNPRDAEAHYGLGDLLEMQHQPRPALAEYREAVRMSPYFAQAWGSMCLVSEEAGQYDDALRAGQEALRINSIAGEPNAEFEFPLHVDMADAYLHKKNWAASLRESQTALALNPANAIAHENLAEAYFGAGRKAEARAEWERVLIMGDPRMAGAARRLLAQHP